MYLRRRPRGCYVRRPNRSFLRRQCCHYCFCEGGIPGLMGCSFPQVADEDAGSFFLLHRPAVISVAESSSSSCTEHQRFVHRTSAVRVAESQQREPLMFCATLNLRHQWNNTKVFAKRLMVFFCKLFRSLYSRLFSYLVLLLGATSFSRCCEE